MEGIKNADYYASKLGRKAKRCNLSFVHEKIQEAVVENKDYVFFQKLSSNQVHELMNLGFIVIALPKGCDNSFRVEF